MKIKNITIGNLVQVKKSMCHSEFKAKQVCEVIDIDPTDKYGFDVLIKGENCLDWVNHKDLKKPEPKLKTLDQSVFDGLDEKWQFAAVDADGKAHRCNLHVKPHHERGEFWRGCTFPPLEFELIGEGYDATNWQNSLIERESKELTGSDLCKAMLLDIEKPVMCKTPKGFDLIKSFRTDGDKYLFHGGQQGEYSVVTPVNSQGEPLTAADVGL